MKCPLSCLCTTTSKARLPRLALTLCLIAIHIVTDCTVIANAFLTSRLSKTFLCWPTSALENDKWCEHCLPGPCEFQETLNGQQLSVWQCACEAAYDGPSCEQDKDGCVGDPCPVGYQCVDVTAEVQGHSSYDHDCFPCLEGFLFVDGQCQAVTHECGSVNCRHGCSRTGSGNETCRCAEYQQLEPNGQICGNKSMSWTWELCSDMCLFGVLPHAACLQRDFLCLCQLGWTGVDCSQDIDECQTNPTLCPETMVCLNSPGNFSCVCPDGMTRRLGQDVCDVNDKTVSHANDDNSKTLEISLGVALFLVVCLSVLLVLYIQRRCREKKQASADIVVSHL